MRTSLPRSLPQPVKDAYNAATTLAMGNLAFGKLHGVWRREWIMDGHQSRSSIDADTRYSWS